MVRNKPGLAHAVPGDARVDSDGLVPVELVDVAGPEVLAVLEPRQHRRGEAHHLALERDHPLVRQVSAQLLHEHRRPVVCQSREFAALIWIRVMKSPVYLTFSGAPFYSI